MSGEERMEDPRIITYLFLGGLGAGACQVLAVLSFLCPREMVSFYGLFRPRIEYRNLIGTGYAAASLALFFGIVCLAADLGRPDRILTVAFNLGASVVNVGAWCLAGLLVCALLLCMAWMLYPRVRTVFVMTVAGVSLVLGFAVMVYTALLLALFAGVPFWDNPLILVLFILSSLSTGCGLIMATSHLCRSNGTFSSAMRGLSIVDIAIVLVEAVALALLVAFSFLDDVTSSAAIALVSGEQIGAFWLGLVGCGLIVPLVVELFALYVRRDDLGFVAGAFALIGGYCLRVCIIGAGLA